MELISMILLAIAGIPIVVAFWVAGIYNKLVHLKALVSEGWSGIDIQLKRRHDLVSQLVAVVKGYSIHEKSIIDELGRMRALSMGATGVAEKSSAEAGISHALKSLFAVAENYPQLKANENFLSLQKEMGALENELQLARRYYNGAARNYNVATRTFPANIVAGSFGFTEVAYFELNSLAERDVPHVQF